MSEVQESEELLRAAALQTSSSIQQVRRRTEDDLIQAKKTLERRTEELARLVALTRATLESTTDGILVTDGQGLVTDYNQKFAEMWHLPREVMKRASDKEVHTVASLQTKDPAAFLNRVAEIYDTSPDETNDLLTFEDGRIFERHSNLQCMNNHAIGRVWSFRDVTDRARSDLLARQLAAIVSSSNDAIVGKNLNSIITSWNAGAERIFGYTAEEMIGQSIMRIVPPNRIAEEDIIRERIRRGVRVEPMETVRVAKDGHLLDVSVTVSPIRDSEGKVVGASKVARDITDRKRSERSMRISEARNAAVLRSALDCIVMINHKGVVLEWNPASERTFGFSRSEAVGRPLHDLILPPKLRVLHVAGLEDYVRTGDSAIVNRRTEISATHADGHEMWVELAITPIPVEGAPVFTAYFRDLTELRRKERALAESHSLLQAVIEGTEDAVFVKDLEGRYQLINPAGARFLNVEPGEIIGRRDDELFPEQMASASMASDRRIIEAEESHTYEDTSPLAGEIRTFLSTKGPYRGADGKIIGIVGISRDISQRKRNEEALEAAKVEAENANRAKSDFLSRMSHELRTPLNAILGFSQLLELGDLDPTFRERVGYIYRAGRHLLDLINEVLDISRIEAGHLELSLEPVHVIETVREACDLMQPLAAERGIQINIAENETSAQYVRADRQRLKQVLLNLLANAVKYNRENGAVTLHFAQQPESSCFRIAIADTGSGIPAEKRARLFTPFERLGAEHTAVQGTGLGLALSKRLAEAMEGSLGFESEIGTGTTFWIDLPSAIAPIDHLAADETLPTLEISESESRTFLYIEDNLSNLTLVEHLMKTHPQFKLISAMKGELGLQLAKRHRPDLILLDVHLPDMDGAEVLKRLRADEATREIPVVVLSADATQRQIDRLTSAGAIEYLTKPIDVTRFFAVIEKHAHASAL